MSGVKHTRGPWWYDAENNAVYDTASNVIIVYEGQLQFKSDGPLIAAAPDLLDLARMVDAWGNGLRHHTAHEAAMVKSARAAIAKAEGGAA